MDPVWVTVLSSVFEVGSLMICFGYIIKGLKSKIDALTVTLNIQKKTLDAMESRVGEVQKIGETYTKFAKELPSYVEDYEKLVRATKDRSIEHLQQEVEMYQKKLEDYAKLDDKTSHKSSVKTFKN